MAKHYYTVILCPEESNHIGHRESTPPVNPTLKILVSKSCNVAVNFRAESGQIRALLTAAHAMSKVLEGTRNDHVSLNGHGDSLLIVFHQRVVYAGHQ